MQHLKNLKNNQIKLIICNIKEDLLVNSFEEV